VGIEHVDDITDAVALQSGEEIGEGRRSVHQERTIWSDGVAAAQQNVGTTPVRDHDLHRSLYCSTVILRQDPLTIERQRVFDKPRLVLVAVADGKDSGTSC